MKFPPWLRDWRVLVGGGGMLAALGYALATSIRVGPPLAPGEVSKGLRRLDGSAPIVPVVGCTYFAVVTTHVGANFASRADIAEAIEAEHFKDVVVSSKRITGWPGGAEGDWYVRATFVGPLKQASYARHQSGFGGSADVADVWESTPG